VFQTERPHFYSECSLFEIERSQYFSQGPQIFSEILQYFYLIWAKNGQNSMKKGLFASLGVTGIGRCPPTLYSLISPSIF